MSEIEKIQRYIARTNIAQNTKSKYGMSGTELLDLGNMPFPKAIITAFMYGRAKGYRAAKAGAARADSPILGSQTPDVSKPAYWLAQN